jgi:hypothetical protein
MNPDEIEKHVKKSLNAEFVLHGDIRKALIEQTRLILPQNKKWDITAMNAFEELSPEERARLEKEDPEEAKRLKREFYTTVREIEETPQEKITIK